MIELDVHKCFHLASMLIRNACFGVFASMNKDAKDLADPHPGLDLRNLRAPPYASSVLSVSVLILVSV